MRHEEGKTVQLKLPAFTSLDPLSFKNAHLCLFNQQLLI